MKWQATMMDCDACGYEWAAVHPVTAEYLECPACHHMAPAPYVEEKVKCATRPFVTRTPNETPIVNPCGRTMEPCKLHGRTVCWECPHCGWSYG